MKTPVGKVLGVLGAFWIARTVARRWREARYDLRGRVVLITGGSRGLGLLLAREYPSRGARLVLVARDSSALERASAELRAGGADVLGISCDVTDRAQARSMVDRALQHFGRLDVLVNDAGRIEVGPLPSMTLDDFTSAAEPLPVCSFSPAQVQATRTAYRTFIIPSPRRAAVHLPARQPASAVRGMRAARQ